MFWFGFFFFFSLTLAEYHEQEEIFKLRLGHLKKVCIWSVILFFFSFIMPKIIKTSTVKIRRGLVKSYLIRKHDTRSAVQFYA